MDILTFQGEHRFLSNFWPSEVLFEGRFYPTVENAYQASKVHPSARAPFWHCSPAEAKKMGRNPRFKDWELRKVWVMTELISQKFAPGSPLASCLVATGSGQLVEGNTWGDTFWGVCNGVGQNSLGRILMRQRAFLQALS